MLTASELLEKAAALRDLAKRAVRLAQGLNAGDFQRLTKYSEDLREQATELEQQAAARRPAEPASDHDDEPKRKKGRGGSNDPEPQT